MALDQTDIEECKKIVEGYIGNPDPGVKIVLSNRLIILKFLINIEDMLMINECFYFFKHKFNDLQKRYDKQSSVVSTKKIMNEGLQINHNEDKVALNENSMALNEEVKRLKLLVQQRDNEIAILLNLINKPKIPGILIALK